MLVGNLAHGVTVGELAQLFEAHGVVSAVELGPGVLDLATWSGYAHVTMPEDSQAQGARKHLHRREHAGRPLRVEPTEANDWSD